MSAPPESLDVSVAGGSLRVAAWPGVGHPVLAIHGITSTSRSWLLLADELDRPILAPDLRGRGRSNALPAPYGMAAHAEDCAAVISAASDQPVTVVGHSMGGFVGTVLAARHPELVRSLVLVDGGLPFPPVDEEAVMAGLAPIKARLTSSYTRQSYRDWFSGHPAFAADWSPAVMEYADYDLPDDPGRPSTRPEVAEADQLDIVQGTAYPEAISRLSHPRSFLHATRGFADDPPGLYPQSTVEEFAARWPDLDVRRVEGVNHYTIVLSSRGARAIAQAVRALDGDGS